MQRDFKLQKIAILTGLAILLAGDAALGFYSWNLQSDESLNKDLTVLKQNRDFLRADIKRAEDIQKTIPAIQKDCDHFEESLFSETTGYSSVTQEIDELAKKAGVQVEGKSFRQKPVKERPLTEIEIDTSVVGNYGSVVRFVNSLQRSSNMYALESLSAKSDPQAHGPKDTVHVTIHLKTYFRTA